MSTARSLFTEAIEDHLALKKQNTTLESSMPLARYDVGDPLERYPGGPVRPAGENTVVVSENAAPSTQADPAFGPSPEQAMEAATLLEPGFVDSEITPLNGMAPMLSLVEDIEEETAVEAEAGAQPAVPEAADVLRFPGAVGPRDESASASADTQLSIQEEIPAAQQTASLQLEEFGEAPTGKQPVIVIDTNESFSSVSSDEVREPSKRKRPRFFGLGRKKGDKNNGDNWFTDGPRDFNWD